MPRGTPDGRIETQQFAAQVSDVAHVNNMLWGFSPINGQGRVIYFDTFNNGLSGVGLSSTGAGIAPALYTGGAGLGDVFSPPYCCKMNPGTVVNDRSFLFREFYAGNSKRLGIEFAVSKNNLTPTFRAQIDYSALGFSPWLGVINFDEPSDVWQIWRGGGVWTTFYSPVASPTNRMHMQVKLVMNFETGYYVKAFIGDYEFDLSAYTMGPSLSSYPGYFISTITAVSRGAGTVPLNLGYILITKDEP